MNDQDKVMLLLTESLKSQAESAERNDRINRRLVIVLGVICVSFCISIAVICSFVPWVYFTADNPYSTIETTDSENTTTTIGGE